VRKYNERASSIQKEEITQSKEHHQKKRMIKLKQEASSSLFHARWNLLDLIPPALMTID
jgi:hypothetical protein